MPTVAMAERPVSPLMVTHGFALQMQLDIFPAAAVVHGLGNNQGDVGARVMGIFEQVLILHAHLHGACLDEDAVAGLDEDRVVELAARQAVLLNGYSQSLHVVRLDVESWLAHIVARAGPRGDDGSRRSGSGRH